MSGGTADDSPLFVVLEVLVVVPLIARRPGGRDAHNADFNRQARLARPATQGDRGGPIPSAQPEQFRRFARWLGAGAGRAKTEGAGLVMAVLQAGNSNERREVEEVLEL